MVMLLLLLPALLLQPEPMADQSSLINLGVYRAN
jgi:hypothetical protein